MTINWPNRITFIRILIIPAFIISLSYDYTKMAFSLFFIGSITDALDGILARVLNQKTKIGAYLDPLADKGLVVSAFYGLWYIKLVPAWLTILVISRDIIIISGVILLNIIKGDVTIKPALISKFTTCTQFLTIFMAFILLSETGLIAKTVFTVACDVTGLLTLISGFQYIYRGITILNMEGNFYNGSTTKKS